MAITVEARLCCPVCRARLNRQPQGFQCLPCKREYRFVFGILDFRVSLPAGFDAGGDVELARLLSERERELDFPGLLHLYYRHHPEPSESLHKLHLAHLAGEEQQARAALDDLERRRPFARDDAVVEVGCGLGQYTAVAAERVEQAIGVDLSLAFLVLARKRLGGRGAVVAAEAERLPFRDGSAAAVIAADVIEHVADQRRSIEEMGRLLIPGGFLFLSTPNRFSLAPEPHVGLWGIGYLPRRWARRYVRRRRRVAYDVHLLSVFSLGRLLGGEFPGPFRIRIPDLSPRQIELFPAWKRALAGLYRALRQLPVLRNVFYLLGPFFHVLAVKDR